MDDQFYSYTKRLKDLKKARKVVNTFSLEVKGSLKTQKAKLVSGSAPSQYAPPKLKLARSGKFSEPGLTERHKSIRIAASSDPPKEKKNVKVGNTFPKTFTTAFEKPPDNLFKTKAVKSIEPWKTPNATPIMLNTPPLRVKGQSLFPIGKTQTETAWKKLMNANVAKTDQIASHGSGFKDDPSLVMSPEEKIAYATIDANTPGATPETKTVIKQLIKKQGYDATAKFSAAMKGKSPDKMLDYVNKEAVRLGLQKGPPETEEQKTLKEINLNLASANAEVKKIMKDIIKNASSKDALKVSAKINATAVTDQLAYIKGVATKMGLMATPETADQKMQKEINANMASTSAEVKAIMKDIVAAGFPLADLLKISAGLQGKTPDEQLAEITDAAVRGGVIKKKAKTATELATDAVAAAIQGFSDAAKKVVNEIYAKLGPVETQKVTDAMNGLSDADQVAHAEAEAIRLKVRTAPKTPEQQAQEELSDALMGTKPEIRKILGDIVATIGIVPAKAMAIFIKAKKGISDQAVLDYVKDEAIKNNVPGYAKAPSPPPKTPSQSSSSGSSQQSTPRVSRSPSPQLPQTPEQLAVKAHSLAQAAIVAAGGYWSNNEQSITSKLFKHLGEAEGQRIVTEALGKTGDRHGKLNFLRDLAAQHGVKLTKKEIGK